MTTSRWKFSAAVLVALPVLASGGVSLAQGLALTTVEVISGLDRPVALAHAGDGSGRLFVVQQAGQILIWDGSQKLATPFLDLSGEVVCCGERGLLGLAFHPDYASNGEFFVHYTRDDTGLESVVARYTVSADPDVADATSEEILLTFDQRSTNHNGGGLAFGPDGYLYISSGDGGGSGDPGENGQDLSTLLGKILRIDVDATDPGLAYAVPATNPFVGVAGALPEIWAYGLRNPWRISFDRATGDLWIGDVGQNLWEEIDHQPAASGGGENYGWDCREGAHPYDDPNGDENADCPAGGFTDPVLEYPQEASRCSVTAGYRYRGGAEPRLAGVYLYADFCTGEVFGTVPRCDGLWESRVLLDAPFNITAFGEDEAGEVYVTEFAGASSKVHLLALAPGSGGPDLAISPSALDFTTVTAGDTVTDTLRLSNANAGSEALHLTTFIPSDPRYELDFTAGAVPCRTRRCLAPGAFCDVGVAFRSPSTGNADASLGVSGNFTSELIPLAAEVTACPTAFDITASGETVTGTASYLACDTLTLGPSFTITSTGDADLCGGTRVVLASGFRVESGGRARVRNDSDCPVP